MASLLLPLEKVGRFCHDLPATAFHHFLFVCGSFLGREEVSTPEPPCALVSVTIGRQCPLIGNNL